MYLCVSNAACVSAKGVSVRDRAREKGCDDDEIDKRKIGYEQA